MEQQHHAIALAIRDITQAIISRTKNENGIDNDVNDFLQERLAAIRELSMMF